MKKSLLLLAFTAISSLGAFAQSYYYFKTTGVPEGYTLSPPTSATTIIAGDATAKANQLSVAQSLPFPFTLFGLNMSQFKASTSGYITFNTSQSADDTVNTTLPSATAPKLAIFAFWDNTRLQTLTAGGTTFASGVKSWVTGTAPNRVFQIQWQLAQTNDGTTATNVTYYAILLHEDGVTFDIVHNYGFGNFTATTGVNNLNGTAGKMVDGSPDMNFGGFNGQNAPTESVVYNFKYGNQPAIDLKMTSNATPLMAGAATGGVKIKVRATNYGSTDVTSAKINYNVNNGAPVTASATISAAKNAGKTIVIHPTNYVPADADANTTKTIKVWFSEINGGATRSDTLTFEMFNNKGISGTKRVLLEQGTGAWCDSCTDGHIIMKQIVTANPDKVIPAAHHYFDLMENTTGLTINDRLANSRLSIYYPYATVDRTFFDDQKDLGIPRTAWASKVTEALATPTPANVSIINKNFDWAAGKVTYTVKVDFVDYAKPGDLRINTFITEDKVRGADVTSSPSSKGWNQLNRYSYEAGNQAGGPGHPLFTEPAEIIGYWHNDVVRAVPSGAWGNNGVITDPSMGKSYTFNYTHTMTKANKVSYSNNTNVDTEFRSVKNGRGWNKYEDTYIIAFVSYYDENDDNKLVVLNAAQTSMINTGVNELAEGNNIGEVSVFPNPTNAATTIDFTIAKGSNVKIEAVNVLGQKVADIANASFPAGSNSVSFDAAKLNSGIYFINIISEDGKASYRFVVSK